MSVIQMPMANGYQILTSRFEGKLLIERVIMIGLTKDEEEQLDNKKDLTVTRNNKTFILNRSNTYCYGEVDFEGDSDDLYDISCLPFLNYLNHVGYKIPSDYDYRTHTCNSPIGRYRWTETWDPADVAIYAHACLGKPKRIAIFIKR